MMQIPLHPGKFLREICLEPLKLAITKTAEYLGVTRKTLSELLNGHTGISPEMSLCLSIAFNTTSKSWLTQQMNYDLWKVRQREADLHVRTL